MNFENIIEPIELDEWIENGKSYQLVDITEENILKKSNVDCDWIPLSRLFENIQNIRVDIPVILCCRHGESSFIIMNILYFQHNIKNVYSLKSGIEGWVGL